MKKIILIIISLIILSGCGPKNIVKVEGVSMDPTYKSGDVCTYNTKKKIERFDVIVFEYKDKKQIKRVIGLPNENIEYKDNKLLINNQEVEEPSIYNHETSDLKDTVKDNCYYVLGDNRTISLDSRMFGCVPKKSIIGVCN